MGHKGPGEAVQEASSVNAFHVELDDLELHNHFDALKDCCTGFKVLRTASDPRVQPREDKLNILLTGQGGFVGPPALAGAHACIPWGDLAGLACC